MKGDKTRRDNALGKRRAKQAFAAFPSGSILGDYAAFAVTLPFEAERILETHEFRGMMFWRRVHHHLEDVFLFLPLHRFDAIMSWLPK